MNGWLRPAIAAALAIGSLIGMTVPAGAQPANREALAAALQTLADEGEAEASYHLGMMRLLGIGGPKDAKAAFDLFRNAAEKGDPLGAYKLGDFYARADNGVVTPDRAEALRLKTIAAEAGYALAQHDVARLHFEAGETDLALEWLTRAAQQGQADTVGQDGGNRRGPKPPPVRRSQRGGEEVLAGPELVRQGQEAAEVGIQVDEVPGLIPQPAPRRPDGPE